MHYPYLNELLRTHLHASNWDRESLLRYKAELSRYLSDEIKNHLRNELLAVQLDPDFSWKEVGGKAHFIGEWCYTAADFDTYVKEVDVLNYFKLITWDTLFPENGFGELQYEKLKRSVFYILRDLALLTPDWIPVNFILAALQKISQEWKNVEVFHMEYFYNHTRYEVVTIDRGVPYPFPNFCPMVSIKSMRLWQAYMNPNIELMPNLFIEDFSEYELGQGLLMKDFKWSVEQTRLIHDLYHTQISNRNG